MSLLKRGTETVKVYPQVVVTDADSNTITKPSAVGIQARAVIQPINGSEPIETSNGGFFTTSKYRLRLVDYVPLLGPQSQIEWQGKRYAIEGEPVQFNGSPRTAHVDYTIVRK